MHFLAGLIGEVGELCAAVVDDLNGWSDHPLAAVVEQAIRHAEVANAAKKANRKGATQTARDIAHGLLDVPTIAGGVPRMEAADVAIYLFDLVELLGIDLGCAIEDKRAELIGRWGDPTRPAPSPVETAALHPRTP